MHLVTFTHSGKSRIGVLRQAQNLVVDLAKCASHLPEDMLEFIALGQSALADVEVLLKNNPAVLPVSDVHLQAPIPRPPRNIICVGKNYPDHVKEVRSVVAGSSPIENDVPESPIIFTKATTSVIGSGDAIPASLDPTQSVDYEGELAIIIGRSGRSISRERAWDHIYGYSIVNDVTSRRMQRKHLQWFLGKSLDGFCPFGPCIVPRQSIDDAGALRVQTRVNNELRQDGYVREMIFNIPSLIETLSTAMTLETGDIIATGTPAGVGMGFKPPKFLKQGDVVAVTIEPIGTLINTVD